VAVGVQTTQPLLVLDTRDEQTARPRTASSRRTRAWRPANSSAEKWTYGLGIASGLQMVLRLPPGAGVDLAGRARLSCARRCRLGLGEPLGGHPLKEGRAGRPGAGQE